MSQNTLFEHLEIRNQDVKLCFTCIIHKKRIEECEKNLMVDSSRPETLVRKKAIFCQLSEGVQFRRGQTFADEDSDWKNESETKDWDSFFFENTDYLLHAEARSQNIRLLKLTIGKEQSKQVSPEGHVIYGSINFNNKVGRTDIGLVYEKNGIETKLAFTTEVLSYKMDYRTDMRSVIKDIEEEFAMLSFTYFRETYLTFRDSPQNNSTDLIWWQVFRDYYKRIIESARYIINNPKRRLQTTVNYERAEKIPYLPYELENEFEEFRNEPAHLYRLEQMYLSKDTIENRFLKYALQSINDRFKRIRAHLFTILGADGLELRNQINEMDEELDLLTSDPFFRGIGSFKGFSQESLIMKQAVGYSEIYSYWIILECGYELQEGIMQLEVKDISDLYEIWCFIKIKNIVQHILRDRANMHDFGAKTNDSFIKTLLKGSKSEITFYDINKPDTQLVSLMYNATTESEEEQDESNGKNNTDIEDTTSKTTEQRPDIVLRLNKTKDGIQYTYLFDAKYRLRDSTIPKQGGVDVPPPGAINQMHRYRDAIYYTQSKDNKLKREVIGGYVLYPGNLDKTQFRNSYYLRSIDEVNIGAFPLKPGSHWKTFYKKDGGFNDPILDQTSSEDELYHRIESWINDTDPLQTLVDNSIPQKGLSYSNPQEAIKCIVINKDGKEYDSIDAKISKGPQFGIAIQSPIDKTGKKHNVLHLDEGLTTAAYLLITNKKNCKLYYLKKGPILLEWKDINGILTTKDGESLYVVFEISGKADPIVPLIDMKAVVKEFSKTRDPKLLPFHKLLKESTN